MSTYERGRVTAARRWGTGISLIEVEMDRGGRAEAVLLEALVGAASPGDQVILNTTAVELGLGSGGYHFVLWNLSRDELRTDAPGHIMKLRYTPLQLNVEAVEEGMESLEPGTLDGLPVVAGSLHSQLLPVAFAYHAVRPGARLVYIMTDGGSLPLAFSRTVAFLKEESLLSETITAGHAFGGDREAVNVFGALHAARHVCGADAVVVTMGPGIAGTGSPLGFSGMELAVVLNAAGSLGGRPIAVPRITFADPRGRHRGLSHHTVTALKYGACVRSVIAFPRISGERGRLVRSQIEKEGLTERHEIREMDVGSILEDLSSCGYEPTVMGRTVGEEPEFFGAACASGVIAAGVRGG